MNTIKYLNNKYIYIFTLIIIVLLSSFNFIYADGEEISSFYNKSNCSYTSSSSNLNYSNGILTYRDADTYIDKIPLVCIPTYLLNGLNANDIVVSMTIPNGFGAYVYCIFTDTKPSNSSINYPTWSVNNQTNYIVNNSLTLSPSYFESSTYLVYFMELQKYDDYGTSGTLSTKFNFNLKINNIDQNLDSIVLSTPSNLTLLGNVLSWNNVENNNGYEIKQTGTNNIYFTSKDVNYYSLPKHGTYQVCAVGNGNDILTSSWSDGVVFNSSTSLNQLSSPVISYNSANNRLSWSIISNANLYYIYKDGYLYDSTTLNHYDIIVSGNYSVSAYDNNGTYGESEMSNIVSVVDVYLSDENDMPVSPGENGTAIDWIKYLAELIEYYTTTIVNNIIYIFQNALNAIKTLYTYVLSFVNTFGNLLIFIPSEIRAVIISMMSLTMVFVVIKFIRG